ncbi:MAG: putative glycolipid-binding domain-containing protein [Actinobacteria bacterium]|nr:putative glycolipid-binding domain-containing protein [Actinomycetota bacterium]
MAFKDLPATAAWRHRQARQGFESVFVRADGPGYRFDGHTAAVEDDAVWVVRYSISVDERWLTRSARIWGWSPTGERETQLDADGSGHWDVLGTRVPELDGCLDVDLESSVLTNTMPVHRLDLRVGQSAPAPAAYMRALDLGVERLEQEYERADDDGDNRSYEYHAPTLGFRCRLVYDPCGLALEYPGIATRVR